MPNFLRKALISLLFDYLFDEFISFAKEAAKTTKPTIDDRIVDWFASLKEPFREEIK